MEAATAAAAANGDVLLMEWFWNANNNPSNLTRVHGDDGYCDSSGYRLAPNILWNNVISGFNASSGCNFVTAYDGPYSGRWQNYDGLQSPCVCVHVGYVGDYMNDRISSFWIRHV